MRASEQAQLSCSAIKSSLVRDSEAPAFSPWSDYGSIPTGWEQPDPYTYTLHFSFYPNMFLCYWTQTPKYFQDKLLQFLRLFHSVCVCLLKCWCIRSDSQSTQTMQSKSWLKWTRGDFFWIKGAVETDASALGRPNSSGSGPALSTPTPAKAVFTCGWKHTGLIMEDFILGDEF